MCNERIKLLLHFAGVRSQVIHQADTKKDNGGTSKLYNTESGVNKENAYISAFVVSAVNRTDSLC